MQRQDRFAHEYDVDHLGDYDPTEDRPPGKRTLTAGLPSPRVLDGLRLADHGEHELDQLGGDGGGRQSRGQASRPAVPVDLQQTMTSWDGQAIGEYGLQVAFSCASSSGRVADLVSQSGLRMREYVTTVRNDFAPRIRPNNPTILPTPDRGRMDFRPPDARAESENRLVFLPPNVDTHHCPVADVREADFAPYTDRALPAVLETNQHYQYSTDGSSWVSFAGPYTIRRELFRADDMLWFTTSKTGIGDVPEEYRGTRARGARRGGGERGGRGGDERGGGGGGRGERGGD